MKPMQTYDVLRDAFAFFNTTLFEDRLSPCMILLHRHRNAYGYFCADRMAAHGDKTKVHEIALNPEHIRQRSAKDTFATLVHEMVHQEQQKYGKPPKGAYHNKQWAAFMKRVGLQPSDTAKPGGKETGRYVSHYVVEGGLFDNTFKAFSAARAKDGFALFGDLPVSKKEKSKTSKYKFECPECGQNAWAKATATLVCGECETPMEGVD